MPGPSELPGLPDRRRGLGHRVLVYFGLRDDEALVARWDSDGIEPSTRIGALVCVATMLAAVIAAIITQF